ncbi:hypothetical protein VNO80_28877 [Phaseolus coccineus]|uniref:Uncharacterized protein n=1 Tax=Phaseolus coccineus TaxID=3886 RepID=A0AAN9LAD4_PHACN
MYDANNLYVTFSGKLCLLLQQLLYDYLIYNWRHTNPCTFKYSAGHGFLKTNLRSISFLQKGEKVIPTKSKKEKVR